VALQEGEGGREGRREGGKTSVVKLAKGGGDYAPSARNGGEVAVGDVKIVALQEGEGGREGGTEGESSVSFLTSLKSEVLIHQARGMEEKRRSATSKMWPCRKGREGGREGGCVRLRCGFEEGGRKGGREGGRTYLHLLVQLTEGLQSDQVMEDDASSSREVASIDKFKTKREGGREGGREDVPASPCAAH